MSAASLPAEGGRLGGEVLRELSRPRTPVDRLRARMTTLAAAGADIIGLRLGMLEADVVSGLRQQGFSIGRDHGAHRGEYDD